MGEDEADVRSAGRRLCGSKNKTKKQNVSVTRSQSQPETNESIPVDLPIFFLTPAFSFPLLFGFLKNSTSLGTFHSKASFTSRVGDSLDNFAAAESHLSRIQ